MLRHILVSRLCMMFIIIATCSYEINLYIYFCPVFINVQLFITNPPKVCNKTKDCSVFITNIFIDEIWMNFDPTQTNWTDMSSLIVAFHGKMLDRLNFNALLNFTIIPDTNYTFECYLIYENKFQLFGICQ